MKTWLDKKAHWLLLAPFLILFAIFILLPVLAAVGTVVHLLQHRTDPLFRRAAELHFLDDEGSDLLAEGPAQHLQIRRDRRARRIHPLLFHGVAARAAYPRPPHRPGRHPVFSVDDRRCHHVGGVEGHFQQRPGRLSQQHAAVPGRHQRAHQVAAKRKVPDAYHDPRFSVEFYGRGLLGHALRRYQRRPGDL